MDGKIKKNPEKIMTDEQNRFRTRRREEFLERCER